VRSHVCGVHFHFYGQEVRKPAVRPQVFGYKTIFPLTVENTVGCVHIGTSLRAIEGARVTDHTYIDR
jgi:hypothetical protein